MNALSIKNFGIIEAVNLEFHEGLTVITGETGAGKSMIIDAIGLLIGGRGSQAFVRHGMAKAEIEGMFEVEETHPVLTALGDIGVDAADGTVILRREIAKSGKSICRMNGKMMTLSTMKAIGRQLIDIHGQHEHQYLLQADKHLSLLDRFGGESLQAKRADYQAVFQDYRQKLTQWQDLQARDKETVQRLDFARFQVDEIDKAALTVDEDEQLHQEKERLVNYERISQALQEGYTALYGEQRGLEWTGRAMQQLEDIAALDDSYRELYEGISASFYQLEEATFSLRDAFEQFEYDPERLSDIESRLYDIQTLKKKYGDTITAILDFRDAKQAEIEQLERQDEDIYELEASIQALREQLWTTGYALSEERQQAAQQLTTRITKELHHLEMPKAAFDVDLGEKEQPQTAETISFYKHGIDDIAFLISTNPGEPLKPLSKVASGGELSRIMLALKSIFSKDAHMTSIIFDEVDTGVSGRAAQAMAEKIYALSVGSQVFCITHLPQVAAMADTHLYITKQETNERTTTDVQALDEAHKIDEVGRMISGAKVTDLTKEHAQELLNLADDMKSS